jgi:hypothetical protein
MKKFLEKVSVKAKVFTGLGISGLAFLAGPAFADGIDTSGITTVFTSVLAAAAIVGAAYLAMIYGMKAYKWIKGAAS